MLTIRPTKMLARRMGMRAPEVAPPVANRVADWCAHEFRCQRYRYLIFCNTASLYPVVTHAREVRDDDALIERLVAALRVTFVGGALEFQFERWIAPELSAVQWAPIPDRSILSSINELIFLAKYELENRDASPASLSRWLAQVPMTALGGNSPDRVFPALAGNKQVD